MIALVGLWALLVAPATGQEPAPAPAPEELPPLTKEPVVLEFVQAPYPPEAQAAGIEATVLLLVEIDETGAVTRVEVLDPVGQGFDEAAADAVRSMKFTPAEDATGPVPVAIEFEYGFTLETAPAPAAGPEPEGTEGPVNLDGVLLEMGTRRPLAGFAVRAEPVVRGGDSALPRAPPPPAGLEATTDDQGRFSFRGVPAGAVTVRAVRPGYDDASREIEVTEGQATSVKLWMRNQSYKADEIIGVYRREQEEVTRRTITVQEVRRIPGTFGDPVRVVQNLPGAARSPLGTGFLIIRGAYPEDSGVYVDGIRIPFIYHLGGYESVLNPDLIDAVDYLPGGYGVQYGRSLGGVVDVRTKSTWPERNRVTWSTDILDSGGLFEGRIGKAKKWGVAVAGRRSYIDFILPLFLGDTGFTVKPKWMDYQVKVDWLGADPGHLSAFAFGFEDDLVASTPPGYAQGTDPSTQGDLGSRYGTHRLLVRWERKLSTKLALRFIPSVGIDTNDFLLGNDWRIENELDLLEVRTELPWTPSEAVAITPGVDFLGGRYEGDVQFPFNPATFAVYDPIAEREPWAITTSGTVWGPDLYLDVMVRPLRDRDRLMFRPGIRVGYVNVVDQYDTWSVDPRASSRWRVIKGGALKAATGIYTQPPQPWESWRPEGGVELGHESSWSSEIGWEQQLGPAIQADATVFYKDMDHLIVPNPNLTSLDDPFFFNDGIGRVYGGELMIRHALVDRFFGWVSYTLSRSERNDNPSAGWEWYPFPFDQTHILVGLASYRLPRDIEVSTRAQYVTGNPYTPYAGGVYDVDLGYYIPYQTGDWNGGRLPPYWTVHARVDKLFTFQKWQLEIYLDLLNALRGTNAEYVVYNYDYTESRYLRGLPFIPSPGFEARFEF